MQDQATQILLFYQPCRREGAPPGLLEFRATCLFLANIQEQFKQNVRLTFLQQHSLVEGKLGSTKESGWNHVCQLCWTFFINVACVCCVAPPPPPPPQSTIALSQKSHGIPFPLSPKTISQFEQCSVDNRIPASKVIISYLGRNTNTCLNYVGNNGSILLLSRIFARIPYQPHTLFHARKGKGAFIQDILTQEGTGFCKADGSKVVVVAWGRGKKINKFYEHHMWKLQNAASQHLASSKQQHASWNPSPLSK